MYDINRLKEAFKNYEIGINGSEEMKRCSVLIPLVKIDGKYNIVFEIRNNKLNSNPGEVCFPGGGIDEGESPREAALRECFEEIGISKEKIDIISQLDFYISPNNILIYPFLGVIKEQEEMFFEKLSLNKDEVYKLITIPLEYFESYEAEIAYNKILNIPAEDFPFQNIIGGKHYKFREGKYKVLFYKYENYVIWGMTARILENFINFYKKSIKTI
ncbi:NUDIX hydrolase [Clostridium sp. B9]|uniref:NUDIX hydrolase n=1 Tax=Clostridium sp. B9 TaxID=3423224 RepID=UPI003D2EC822